MACWLRHKWVDVNDRCQRCSDCGLVRVLPCAHEWESLDEIHAKYRYSGGDVIIVVQRCKHCGELNKVKIVG